MKKRKDDVPTAEAPTIREIKQKRLEACNAEIGALLQRHGCVLVGVPFITPDGRTAARVEMVCKE